MYFLTDWQIVCEPLNKFTARKCPKHDFVKSSKAAWWSGGEGGGGKEWEKKKYKRDEMKNNVVEYFWNYNKTIKIHNCDAVWPIHFSAEMTLYQMQHFRCRHSFSSPPPTIFLSSSHNHLISPALRIGSFKWINKGERCVFMTLFYAVFTHLLLSLIH